jgi:hypothetical protein
MIMNHSVIQGLPGSSSPRLLLPLIALLACLGCASVPSHPPSGDQLKGKTQQDLLTCAGPPTSESKTADGLVLVYYRAAWSLDRSSEDRMTGSRPGCRATIRLQDDRVADVRYLSVPESAGAWDHCERIFSGCAG